MTRHRQVHVIEIQRVRRRAVDQARPRPPAVVWLTKHAALRPPPCSRSSANRMVTSSSDAPAIAAGDIVQHALPGPSAGLSGISENVRSRACSASARVNPG